MSQPIFFLTVVVVAVLVLGLCLYRLMGRHGTVLAWKNKVATRLSDLERYKPDQRFLIMELDKVLEFALQQKFNQAAPLGQLLKDHAASFTKSDLNEIWRAHKLRNDLAHNFDSA